MTIDPTHHIYNIQLTKNVFKWNLFISKFSSAAPIDGKRNRDKSEVPCPVQMKDYCKTFYLIDKGNEAEVYYNMGEKSRKHNW